VVWALSAIKSPTNRSVMPSVDVDPRLSRSVQVILHGMGLDAEILGNEDVDWHRKKIDEWLEQYGLKIGEYAFPCDGMNIVNALSEAKKLKGWDRIHQLFLAYRKTEMLYYGLWSKIEGHKTPMSEETKQILKEAKEAKREAEGKPPPQPRVKGQAKSRVPLWQARAAQEIKEKQYPWIKPHSWHQDSPDKPNSTSVIIICQDCKDERVIHAADAFQVKRCKECKKKRPSTDKKA
jgi:ribosomal protein S27E